MKSVTINITEEVIKASTKSNSSKCMIAQALRKRGASSVNVTAESARFNLEGVRYSYPLPAKAAAKLLQFDKGQNPEPFKFVLTADSGTSAPIVTRPDAKKRGPTRKRKATKQTVKRCKRRFHGLRAIEIVK